MELPGGRGNPAGLVAELDVTSSLPDKVTVQCCWKPPLFCDFSFPNRGNLASLLSSLGGKVLMDM